MRKREAIQPRKLYCVEADPFSLGAGRNVQSISETVQVPPGSRERGERAMVISTYLGGLAGSVEVFSTVRAIEVLQTERT